MGVFKNRKKRPTGPWDWLIEHGASEEDYEKYEAALAKGDITEAQALEAKAVGDVKPRRK